MSTIFYQVPQDFLKTLYLFTYLGPQFSDTGNVVCCFFFFFLAKFLKPGD